jgi:hypothetical protein
VRAYLLPKFGSPTFGATMLRAPTFRAQVFRTLWRAGIVGVAVATALASATHAAPPEASLASLVPADVGLCVEVSDLASHLEQFQTSELYRRLRAFPPLRAFLTENVAAFTSLSAELRQQTGLAPQELLEQLLGKRLLVGVWPGAIDSQSAPGPAVLLVECVDADVANRVLERLLAAERAADRRVAQLNWQHGKVGCAIYRIEAIPGQPSLYVAATDRLGIVATDESIVRKVLDHRAGVAAAPSLAARREYAAGMARLNPESVARVFINPRAWESLFADQGSLASDVIASGTQGWLAEQFRAADYLVLSCQLSDNVVFEAFLQKRSEALVGATDSSAEQEVSHADLAHRLPAGAVAALAGRVDLPALFSVFSCDRPASSAGEARTSVATNELSGVQSLARLIGGRGHEAVAALLPRQAADHGEAPSSQPSLAADWVVGFDAHSLLPDDRLAFGERVNPILRGALTAAIMMYSRQGQSTSIDSVEEEGVPLTSVEGLALLGQGDNATFSLLKEYFWAGTSRDAVRDTARLEADQSLAANPRFQALANPRLGRRSHFAYVDLAALRRLLTSSTAAQPRAREAAPAVDEAGREFQGLLELADRILIEVQLDPVGIGISATVTADAAP